MKRRALYTLALLIYGTVLALHKALPALAEVPGFRWMERPNTMSFHCNSCGGPSVYGQTHQCPNQQEPQ